MFIILLRFSSNKALAGQFINEHKTWLNHGFDDGVFVLAGSIQPGLGGTVIAHNCSLSEIQARVDTDPFVQENIVTAEILEIEPGRSDSRLAFMG